MFLRRTDSGIQEQRTRLRQFLHVGDKGPQAPLTEEELKQRKQRTEVLGIEPFQTTICLLHYSSYTPLTLSPPPSLETSQERREKVLARIREVNVKKVQSVLVHMGKMNQEQLKAFRHSIRHDLEREEEEKVRNDADAEPLEKPLSICSYCKRIETAAETRAYRRAVLGPPVSDDFHLLFPSSPETEKDQEEHTSKVEHDATSPQNTSKGRKLFLGKKKKKRTVLLQREVAEELVAERPPNSSSSTVMREQSDSLHPYEKKLHIYPNGDIYEGDSTLTLTLTLTPDPNPNPNPILGEFGNNEAGVPCIRQGKGVFQFKNGDTYVGEFKDNKISGTGTFR